MGLVIKSDFKDFYDNICDDTGIVYNRYLSNSMQRGVALNRLRELGIKTIDIKQVTSINRTQANKLVVYTNSKLHESKGKMIVPLDEAYEMYPAHLASIFYTSANGITLKYLQIGSLRFRLYFQSDIESLEKGKLYKIEKLSNSNDRFINLPIYSIDYIFNGKDMIATDFNEVQNLEKIYMNNYVSSEDIVKEILKTL